MCLKVFGDSRFYSKGGFLYGEGWAICGIARKMMLLASN